MSAIIANLPRRHHHPGLLRLLPVGVLAAGAGGGATLAVLAIRRTNRWWCSTACANLQEEARLTTPQVLDHAITSTISRTIITHGSTQMMVLSMLLFGGETLYYFALALTIGICFGIYSSVLVASPLVMWLGVSRRGGGSRAAARSRLEKSSAWRFFLPAGISARQRLRPRERGAQLAQTPACDTPERKAAGRLGRRAQLQERRGGGRRGKQPIVCQLRSVATSLRRRRRRAGDHTM